MAFDPERYNPVPLEVVVRPDTNLRDTAEAWAKLSDADSIPHLQAQAIASGMLSRTFIDRTQVALDKSYSGQSTFAEIQPWQQGRKTAVYFVSTPEHKFILQVAKNGGRLSDELRQDFADLIELRRKLIAGGLPVFVPKPLALTEYQGIAGFSVEYLPDHLELICQPDIGMLYAGIKLPVFKMNTAGAKTEAFEAAKESAFKAAFEAITVANANVVTDMSQIQRILSKGMYHSPFGTMMERIKEEMVASLYIVNRLTGCVPREFQIGAGDFMADPDKADYDLKLITVRGGFKDMQAELFPLWLATYEDFVDFRPDANLPPRIPYHLDFHIFNKQVILGGIAKGQAILAAA